MKFTREIIISPAWDKRDPDPTKDYGIHCCDQIFLLQGSKGVISFVIFTGWYLPSTIKDYVKTGRMNTSFWLHTDGPAYPMGTYISYHGLTQLLDEDGSKKYCRFLKKKAYCGECDGLFRGEELGKLLVEKGSEAMWKELEKYYKRLYGNTD